MARNQLQQVLPDLRVIDSQQSLFLAVVSDPYDAVKLIRERITGNTPMLRVIPVDAVTSVDIAEVAQAVHDVFYRKASREDSFKVEVDGRLYAVEEGRRRLLHTREAIEYIASFIDNPVRLKDPDYLVYIKTLRVYGALPLAAITVCRPSDIIRYAAGRAA